MIKYELQMSIFWNILLAPLRRKTHAVTSSALKSLKTSCIINVFLKKREGNKCYRWCFVPKCKSTGVKNQEKIFLCVLKGELRKKSYKTVRRDMCSTTSLISIKFCYSINCTVRLMSIFVNANNANIIAFHIFFHNFVTGVANWGGEKEGTPRRCTPNKNHNRGN